MMDQRTREWLEWRKLGIGSSDAPIICGVSKYHTPYELYLQKTMQGVIEDAPNYIQAKGNQLEPIARARYELATGLEMKPSLHQHYEFGFMRASTDGSNPVNKRGLEIKYVGEEDFETIRQGGCPVQYYPQVQHGLFVTGYDQFDLCGYFLPKGKRWSDGIITISQVAPNLEFLRGYFHKAVTFYLAVQNRKPPKFTDADFKSIKVKGLAQIAQEYKRRRREIEALEAEMQDVTDRIIEVAEESQLERVRFGGLKLEKIEKDWRIEIAKPGLDE